MKITCVDQPPGSVRSGQGSSSPFNGSSRSFMIAALDLGVGDDEDLTASFKLPKTQEDTIRSDDDETAPRTRLAAFLVVIMGAAAAASFLYLGITYACHEADDEFERRASDLAQEIDAAWQDYETAGLWVHQSCHDWRKPNNTQCDREGFERLYHYLVFGGLDFYGVEWVPNITHAEREQIEAEGQVGWGDLMNYTGMMGQEPDPDHPGELQYAPRSEHPFYFPIQFAEPAEVQAGAAHYDLYSAPWERPAIDKALQTWKPALTGRFRLVHEVELDGYSVVLYHPGVPLPDKFNVGRPKDLANLVIHISSLLKRATRYQSEGIAVYLYDKTATSVDDANPPEFLSALENLVSSDGEKYMRMLPDTDYASLQESSSYYEQDIEIGGRTWVVVVVPIDDTFKPNLTFIIISGVMIFVASCLLALWMFHNMTQQSKMNNVVVKAAAEASLVSDMFPLPRVRDRMIRDARARNNGRSKEFSDDVFRFDGTGRDHLSERKLNNFLTSEGIFGSKPIAELHPHTTVMFADIVGFSAWSSVREPSQVFQFLEIVYHSWDRIAKRRGVFKVSSHRDSYTAVAGLPETNKDHAVAMAKFATDCAHRVRTLCHALEKTLGPETAELGCRIGLHSGQVLAGVLRGDKNRFELFGDTVHKASQIEATCVPNTIQISQETAELLIEAGHGKWCIPRADLVFIKGKGQIQTYLLKISKVSSIGEDCRRDIKVDLDGFTRESTRTDRLVKWNIEVLSSLLCSIVARREALAGAPRLLDHTRRSESKKGSMVLDEVSEVIPLPTFNASVIKKQVDPATIKLDPEVVAQITKLVERIASMYRSENPFHNFDHASHVVMSVLKMMRRIVDPKEVAVRKRKKRGDVDSHGTEAELHDHTFGITSDPLTQFACGFSALIHDLDHHGVPNAVLVREKAELALKYKGKSVQEQNSVDLAWGVLMKPEFEKLRSCICADQEEFTRFRALVVNAVMATDLLDQQLGAARKLRWNRAFREGDDWMGQQEGQQTKINRKATIVIEHLIQASDIAHCMQHWHVYAKWNERLFHEMYKAFKDGRLKEDPSEQWYQQELDFFDNYVIPIAKDLYTCGVFGVSSDELSNYAQVNRKEWAEKGGSLVKQYLTNFHEMS